MKKSWENPIVNGLGLEETNTGAQTEARYEIITNFSSDSNPRYKCLGVFNVVTGAQEVECGRIFDTYLLWAAHAEADHVPDLILGETGTGVLPVS